MIHFWYTGKSKNNRQSKDGGCWIFEHISNSSSCFWFNMVEPTARGTPRRASQRHSVGGSPGYPTKNKNKQIVTTITSRRTPHQVFFLDISASGGAQVARTDEQSSFNLVKLPTDHSQSRQAFNIVNLVSCFFCDLRHMRCFTIHSKGWPGEGLRSFGAI